jgi:hypothetical protein
MKRGGLLLVLACFIFSLAVFVIAKIIQAYEDDMGKAVRYTLMDEREFRDRREIGDRFLYSIFEAKHIMVVNRFESVH